MSLSRFTPGSPSPFLTIFAVFRHLFGMNSGIPSHPHRIFGGLNAVATAFLVFGSAPSILAQNPTLEYFHRFGQDSGIGRFLESFFADGSSGIYGTTQCCGAGTTGTGGVLFALDAQGANPSPLVRFGDLAQSGRAATAPVLTSDGKIHILANLEIPNGRFLVTVNPDGTGRVVGPNLLWASLVAGTDGRLYGTANAGIRSAGADGTDLRTLHEQTATDGGIHNLTDCGAVGFCFIDQPTSTGTGQHRLNRIDRDGTNRNNPHLFERFREVVQIFPSNNGFIYGSTSAIVSQSGTSGAQLFRIRPDGTGFEVLHVFDVFRHPTDAFIGYGGRAFLMEASDGLIYGTFATSGHMAPGYAFRIARDGSGYTKLFDFPSSFLVFDPDVEGGSGLNRSEVKPFAEMPDGYLAGMTSIGGYTTPNYGVAYRFNKDGSDFSITARMGAAPDAAGLRPRGPMVAGPDSALYGTAINGGIQDFGTVWRIDSDGGDLEVLKAFPLGSANTAPDGKWPCGVSAGPDGWLFGATVGGGHPTEDGFGTVYRIKRDGTGFEVLRRFIPTDGDCRIPQSPPLLASDGRLYGTTEFGGGSAVGAIYRLRPDGSEYAVIHRFTGTVNGANPVSRLLEGADGRLYGTAPAGGPDGGGVVFALNKDGSSFTLLHAFDSSGTGLRTARGSLLQMTDLTLVGTASNGGSGGFGGVFRIRPDGTDYIVLHSFSSTGGDGRGPVVGLSLGADGLLYGTTQFGGGAVNGSLFRLKPDGSAYQKLYGFGAAQNDGATPASPLVLTSSGHLAGSTFGDPGTLFRLKSALPSVPNPTILKLSDGSTRIELPTPVGAPYVLEFSNNLLDWSPLQDGVLPASVVDPSTPELPLKYYRFVVGE